MAGQRVPVVFTFISLTSKYQTWIGRGYRGRVAADAVDRILEQWARTDPDLDVSPMAIVGRVSRLSRIVDRRLADNFAEHGIDDWMYDVLATLYRSGQPWELSPTELVDHTMVTTGAMTNRIDRLSDRGLVTRRHDTHDRRRVVVALTSSGRALVERVAPDHYRLEAALLETLSTSKRKCLEQSLRTLLISLGDTRPDD
jgi:DNA-binding MarR family transcriptional regulator